MFEVNYLLEKGNVQRNIWMYWNGLLHIHQFCDNFYPNRNNAIKRERGRDYERKNEQKSRRKSKEKNDTGFFERTFIFKLSIFYQYFPETRYVSSRMK